MIVCFFIAFADMTGSNSLRCRLFETGIYYNNSRNIETFENKFTSHTLLTLVIIYGYGISKVLSQLI